MDINRAIEEYGPRIVYWAATDALNGDAIYLQRMIGSVRLVDAHRAMSAALEAIPEGQRKIEEAEANAHLNIVEHMPPTEDQQVNREQLAVFRRRFIRRWTPDELRALLKLTGFRRAEAAKLLGISLSSIEKRLSGAVPIRNGEFLALWYAGKT